MANDTLTSELARWQDRLAVVSRNLGEINELPALQRIKMKLRTTPDFYAGETAVRITDALAALDDLWKDYLLLNALLDEADGLRKRSGLFHDHDANIAKLLHGRSITLPLAHVPLAERGLLTTAERADKVTPDELLAAMNALFALAKDTVLKLDETERSLKTRLEALASSIQELAQRAKALGFNAAEVAAIAGSVDALRATSIADPLAAERKLTEGEHWLAEWRTQIEYAERQRDGLEADLAAAAAALVELRRLSEQAKLAHDTSRAKIADVRTLPPPTASSVIMQMGTWLEMLAASREQGDWRAACSGLDKWMTACTSHLEAERRIIAANRAPIAQRDELRGRLKALRAKADAYAARGIRLDARAVRLGDEAKDILYSQPGDLKRAGELVNAYEAAISLASQTS
jgi:chaperonin cofactor prefoldin